MTVRFENDLHPRRLSRSLQRLLAEAGRPSSLTESREILAGMLGHGGWDALVADCRLRPPPSPPDHAVDEAEREGRRRRALGALAAAGLDGDRAQGILSRLSPTAPRRSGTGTSMPDAAVALAGAPGADSILAALREVAADDLYFAERAALAAHGRTSRTTRSFLSAVRGDPAHPGWGGLLLGLARHLAGDDVDVANAFRAGDAAGCVAALAAMGMPHLQDRFSRFAGFYAAELHPDAFPAPRPRPNAGEGRRAWLPAYPPLGAFRPTGWYRLRPGDLAALDLLYDDVAEEARVSGVLVDGPEWRSFAATHPEAGLATARTSDEVRLGYLVRDADGVPRQGLAVSARIGTGPRIALDVRGPFATDAAAMAYEPYLALAVAQAVLDEIGARARSVAPGGRMVVTFSPEHAPGGDPLVQEILDCVALGFALREDVEGTYGFDLLACRATLDGTLVRMPGLHRTGVPAEAAEGWADFLDMTRGLNLAHGGAIRVRAEGDGLSARGPEGEDLDGWVIAGPHVARAVRAVVAESGLGADAELTLGLDYAAVAAAAMEAEDDWSRDRRIALVVSDPPPREGEWERMRAAFWRDHHERLEAIIESRAERGESAGRPQPPAPRTLQ